MTAGYSSNNGKVHRYKYKYKYREPKCIRSCGAQTWELFSRSVAICQCRSPHRVMASAAIQQQQQEQLQQARHLSVACWCCCNAPARWPLNLANNQEATSNNRASQPGALIYQSQAIIILLKSANLICFSMLLDKLLPLCSILAWCCCHVVLLLRSTGQGVAKGRCSRQLEMEKTSLILASISRSCNILAE